MFWWINTQSCRSDSFKPHFTKYLCCCIWPVLPTKRICLSEHSSGLTLFSFLFLCLNFCQKIILFKLKYFRVCHSTMWFWIFFNSPFQPLWHLKSVGGSSLLRNKWKHLNNINNQCASHILSTLYTLT